MYVSHVVFQNKTAKNTTPRQAQFPIYLGNVLYVRTIIIYLFFSLKANHDSREGNSI